MILTLDAAGSRPESPLHFTAARARAQKAQENDHAIHIDAFALAQGGRAHQCRVDQALADMLGAGGRIAARMLGADAAIGFVEREPA